MKGIVMVSIFLLVSMSLVSSSNNTDICNKIYFKVVEKHWNLTIVDLNEINTALNVSNTDFFLDNYQNECYNKSYSPKLPEKIIPKINLLTKEIKDCDPDVFFPFTLSLNFFTKETDMSCGSISFFKYIFSIHKSDSGYYFEGIRIFTILFLAFVIFILIRFFKYNSRLNEIIYEKTYK